MAAPNPAKPVPTIKKSTVLSHLAGAFTVCARAGTDTTPAEQPEENINSGWEDAAPVEQPAAPAEPSPAPEPVVTPQAPTATTLTDEERLVATGKWTKISEGINSYTGKAYSIYEGIDPLTGYKIGTVFSDGTLTGLQTNTKEEACAIAQAHRAT